MRPSEVKSEALDLAAEPRSIPSVHRYFSASRGFHLADLWELTIGTKCTVGYGGIVEAPYED